MFTSFDQETFGRLRRIVLLGSVLAFTVVAADGTRAQGANGPGNDYCIRHTFKLRPQGNIAPVVSLVYKAHTFAKTNSCKDDDKISGSVPAGLGLTTMTVMSSAPDSNADATAESNITALAAGQVDGTIEARGNANALITGCPPPALPRGSGRATAFSAAQITARGRSADRRGNIRWSGGWYHSLPVAGNASREIVRDPIRARLIDNTTGVTTEFTLLSLKASLGGGDTGWDEETFSNTAPEMTFDLVVDSPVTVEQGRLRVAVVGGIVTESVATGIFEGTPIPSVGEGGGFSVPLPEISLNFDLGGDESHDLEAEFEFDGAGQTEENASGSGLDGGSSLVTDLATGADGTHVSEVSRPDTTYGFDTGVATSHVADDFIVLPGSPMILDALMLPVYQTNAPPNMPIAAAFARIWRGQPGAGGIPIAGDMNTNRLNDVQFLVAHRVGDNPMDRSRPVQYVYVDLSWAPPLPAGQYWIEFASRGQGGFDGPWMPPAVWSTESDNAIGLDVRSGQWTPLRDQGSQRRVGLPLLLYGSQR